MKQGSTSDHENVANGPSAADQLFQINISYVPGEDRLLLRVSTTGGDEYRVWLTRRFVSLLMGLLQKEMEQYGGAPSLAANKETTRLFKEGALEKKYDAEKSTEFPLGQQGILAYRAELQRRSDGILILQILPGQGRGVTLNLNKNLLYLFYNILTQGVEQAEWRLTEGKEVAASLH